MSSHQEIVDFMKDKDSPVTTLLEQETVGTNLDFSSSTSNYYSTKTAIDFVSSTSSYHTTRNTSVSATEPYEKLVTEAVIWTSGAIIFTMLVVGIVLNSVTVMVILTYPRIRTVFTYFIFSLCISDLISAAISPIFWYRRTLGFDEWQIPKFFCNFYWAADLMTSIATALHIVAFGVLRYASIKWPLHQAISKRVALTGIAVIWIISIACGFVPFYLLFEAKRRDRNSNAKDARWPACTTNMNWYDQYKSFQKIAYSTFLYVPLMLVVIISIATSLEVHSATRSTISRSASARSRRRRDRQAVIQLLLIAASFILGYLPFTVYEFWSTQDIQHTPYTRRVDFYFGMIEYFFLRFSECLNPIFYNLGSSNMRSHTKYFLRHGCAKKKELRRKSIPTLTQRITSPSAA